VDAASLTPATPRADGRPAVNALLALHLGACRLHPRVAASLPKFCAVLSSRAGFSLSPETLQSYEELFAAFTAGKVALSWMPPVLLARALDAGGTLLAVPQRAGAMAYRAAILVRKNSDARTLEDLRGRRAAWVDRASASGYLFPRLELTQRHGFDAERPFSSEMFHGTTVRAAAAVASGEADLCACFVTESAIGNPERAAADLSRALGPLADRLRPMHFSERIPPDGLIASAHLDAKTRDQLARALLTLHESVEGAEALQALLQATGLNPPPTELARSLEIWK
jgi:phosphonate transport system substrate-binding protein